LDLAGRNKSVAKLCSPGVHWPCLVHPDVTEFCLPTHRGLCATSPAWLAGFHHVFPVRWPFV
jgi:hypothetical protein